MKCMSISCMKYQYYDIHIEVLRKSRINQNRMILMRIKVYSEELVISGIDRNNSLMLGSHCRLLSIDSDVHRQNEECGHVPTKEPCVNKVDDSPVDEVEHVLLLVDFC